MGTKRVGLARIEALIENLKREIAFGGGTMVGIGWSTEVLVGSGTAKSLEAADNGRCYVVDTAASGQTFNLPTPAAGLRFRFICQDTDSNDIVITATSDGSSAANIMAGQFIVNGAHVNAASKDLLTLGASSNNHTAGDWVECWCDGTNWWATGMATVASSLTLA